MSEFKVPNEVDMKGEEEEEDGNGNENENEGDNDLMNEDDSDDSDEDDDDDDEEEEEEEGEVIDSLIPSFLQIINVIFVLYVLIRAKLIFRAIPGLWRKERSW